MSYDVGDVEVWLGRTEGDLNQDILDRIKAAVDAWAEANYDLTSADERADQALIEECGRRYRRRVAAGGTGGTGDSGPVIVNGFDSDIAGMLFPYLKVVGIFGPSTPDEAA